MRSPPWNDQENAAVCRLYFDMLSCATAGSQYNKAAMIRSYQFTDEGKHPEALSARSRGSIEAKLMNCTAAHALADPEAETMAEHGYRPLSNMQAALAKEVRLAWRQVRDGETSGEYHDRVSA